MQTVKIKKMNENATIPARGSWYAAGYDLYAELPGAADELWIMPHKTAMVPTGIAVEIPEGYFGALYARSGLASKRGLRPANCVGVIDSDYRGEVIVALHNDGDTPQIVEYHERIAQLVIQPYLQSEFELAEELGTTERNEGGFGSTGAK